MMGFAPGIHGARDLGGRLELAVDVAVLGAGPAGCAAALVLVEQGRRVALLDSGRHWPPGTLGRDMAFALRYLFDGRGPRAAVGNVVVPVTAGRGIGGGSLVNSAICFRAPPAVLREWREEHGAERFTDEAMEAAWTRLWRLMRVRVDPPEVQGPNNLAFFRGAEALGLPVRWFERNTPGCLGCAACARGCPVDGKWTVDRALLPPALETGRLGVFAGCRVEVAETRGDRVLAVRGAILDPDTDEPVGHFRVAADRFVLAMGAIQTPRFLLANALGNAVVGQHLRLHPAAPVLARMAEPVDPWFGTTQGCYVDLPDAEGVLLETVLLEPDQLYLMLPLPWAAERIADVAHLGSSGLMVRDLDSRGSVGPAGLRYLLGDGDRRRFLHGVRRCGEVLLAAGAEEVFVPVASAFPARTPDELRVAASDHVPPGALLLYASHPQGTCRIHPDPALGAVDPAGRLHGRPNVSVVDASVFPSAVGVNPMMTIMAAAMVLAASA